MRVFVSVDEIKNVRLKYKNRYVDLYAWCDTFESVETALGKKGLSGIIYTGLRGLEPYKGRFTTKVYHCVEGGYDVETDSIWVGGAEYPDEFGATNGTSEFRPLEGVQPLILLDDEKFDRFDLLESFIEESGIDYLFVGGIYAGFIGSKYVGLLSDSEKTPLSITDADGWYTLYEHLEQDKIEWTNGISNKKSGVKSKSKKVVLEDDGDDSVVFGKEHQKSVVKKVKKPKPVFGGTLRTSDVEF